MGLFIQGDTKITQDNGRVDGGAVPDRALDLNSKNSVGNDIVTAKFDEVDEEIDEMQSVLAKNTITIEASSNTYLANNVVVEKINGVVELNLRGLANITPQTAITLFTLPAEFRPTYSKYFEFITPSGSVHEYYTISVNPNGAVTFYDYSSGASDVGNLNQTLSFIV